MGFEWFYDGKAQFFCFCFAVLPFGALSSFLAYAIPKLWIQGAFCNGYVKVDQVRDQYNPKPVRVKSPRYTYAGIKVYFAQEAGNHFVSFNYKGSNFVWIFVNMYIHKYNEELVILQLIGIIVIKRKETKVITTPADILVGI